jgi:mRNA interferase RelE/StbE
LNSNNLFEVFIDKRVYKDLDKIPKHISEKFLEIIDEFEIDPIHSRPKFDVKQLRGFSKDLYRLRIGNFRVLYSVEKENRVVRITTIVPRQSAYK